MGGVRKRVVFGAAVVRIVLRLLWKDAKRSLRAFAKNNELALETNGSDHASSHPAVWAFKTSEHNFVIFRMNDAGKFRFDIDGPIWSMSDNLMIRRVHHKPILVRRALFRSSVRESPQVRIEMR